MGRIVILFPEGTVIPIAQGGAKKTATLFFSSLNELVLMAELLGGELHYICYDRKAWEMA